MNKQRKTEIIEQRVPRYMRTRSGCEVVSNKGDIMITLVQVRNNASGNAQSYYSTNYYIKENDGWVRTNTSKTYSSIAEFIRDISVTDEFSQAYDDFKEQEQ